MARLRIRVELSRGGVGVPLHKLASVLAASEKFLNSLSEDVRIDKQPGEWLAFDFDRENLNFTAEYVGAVTARQVEAFNAAFDGTTSLRRDTISHFLQVTEAIGEDEVIGFGLYQEDTAEPTEWRCLSRRDALRIADEVQILMGAGQAPHLPAASDPGLERACSASGAIGPCSRISLRNISARWNPDFRAGCSAWRRRCRNIPA